MLLGIVSQRPGASMALIDGNEIVWAGIAERYSRIKNESLIHPDMVEEMLRYGKPKKIIWADQPFPKFLRQLYYRQRPIINNPRKELKRLGLNHLPVEYVDHSLCHAAAGFYTSEFEDAAVLVVDTVGEWESTAIWTANSRGLKQKWFQNYPHSMGEFYSLFMRILGLNDHNELMTLSAQGHRYSHIIEDIKTQMFDKFDAPSFRLKHNPQKDHDWWKWPEGATPKDIAAAVQAIMEEYLVLTAQWMKENLPSENLVFMGPVALNSIANSLLARIYRNIWIMPNPGDSGNAIGAVAAFTKKKLSWQSPYLGTDIAGELDIDSIINDLAEGKLIGIARGRTEFTEAALGNRIFLCDLNSDAAQHLQNMSRSPSIAVLEEHAFTHFEMPVKTNPYMQFTVRCRDAKKFNGICGDDKTIKVQTVNSAHNPLLKTLLHRWYEKTNNPMLLTANLMTKLDPLLNSKKDAQRFELLYGIKIY